MGWRNYSAGLSVATFCLLWALCEKPVLFAQDRSHAKNPQGLTNSIGMKLALIPAGEFLMGSTPEQIAKYALNDRMFLAEDAKDEMPQHRARISQPFYMGAYEVTRGEFAEFVKATGYITECERDGIGGRGYHPTKVAWSNGHRIEENSPLYHWRNTGFAQTDRHPVVNVGWNDAVAFCEWLSNKEGRKYQLPSEAQWEYACRAGSSTMYFNGDDQEKVVLIGNTEDATARSVFHELKSIKSRDGFVYTAPVGSFPANSFGLHDMHGNACEWCNDVFAQYTARESMDPIGANPKQNGPELARYQPDVQKEGFSEALIERVYRGGSWYLPTNCARSAHRLSKISRSDFHLGFRVVLSQTAN